MILNLTGSYIILGTRHFPDDREAPIAIVREGMPEDVTALSVLLDTGMPEWAARDILNIGAQITEAPAAVDVRGFPDLAPDVSAVIVSPEVAEAMQRAGLRVREGVAVLTLVPLAGIYATLYKKLHIHPDLTGEHHEPGLARDPVQNPVDAALYRLCDGTGVTRISGHIDWRHGKSEFDVMACHPEAGRSYATRGTWAEVEAQIVAALREAGVLLPEVIAAPVKP